MAFSVMQWNCMYSEDLESIVGFIKSIDPDIVCLQELTHGYHRADLKTGEYIAEKLGYHAYCAYGPMVLPDGSQTFMGNGILARFPISFAKTVAIQKGNIAGNAIKDERYYIEVTLMVEGVEVHVGTTHLPFHPRFQTTAHKQSMVNRILSEIPEAGNYILAGDFNTTPQTKSAKTFRSNGLKNAGPSLSRPTWTTKPFSISQWSYSELQYRLDYVLHRGGLTVVKSGLIDTQLSDHLPILAVFELD